MHFSHCSWPESWQRRLVAVAPATAAPAPAAVAARTPQTTFKPSPSTLDRRPVQIAVPSTKHSQASTFAHPAALRIARLSAASWWTPAPLAYAFSPHLLPFRFPNRPVPAAMPSSSACPSLMALLGDQ